MTRHALTVLAGCSLASAALGNPVDGDYFDDPNCDSHGMRQAIEELGTGMFPTDELISAQATFTDLSACAVSDDTGMLNTLVTMTNLSGRDWTDLFYVGDVETRLSNFDGFATTNEAPPPDSFLTFAFRIDAEGANRNLVFESASADGVFEAGETWQFIIQDYENAAGISAAAMGSLDFAGGSLGDALSSGSIVQFPVPAPGATALFALSGLAAARRRR